MLQMPIVGGNKKRPNIRIAMEALYQASNNLSTVVSLDRAMERYYGDMKQMDEDFERVLFWYGKLERDIEVVRRVVSGELSTWEQWQREQIDRKYYDALGQFMNVNKDLSDYDWNKAFRAWNEEWKKQHAHHPF